MAARHIIRDAARNQSATPSQLDCLSVIHDMTQKEIERLKQLATPTEFEYRPPKEWIKDVKK